MQPGMIRIVIPAQRIVGNVSADGIKFLVVPDNPLVVVSLPKWPYRGEVVRSDLAADRALETANCFSQRSRLRTRVQVGTWHACHRGARQHDDAVQMVWHHHPDVECQPECVSWEILPTQRRDLADRRKAHLAIFDVPEQAEPSCSANRDEVRPILGVIEPGQPDRLAVGKSSAIHSGHAF
jgi:hypothetical protein